MIRLAKPGNGIDHVLNAVNELLWEELIHPKFPASGKF